MADSLLIRWPRAAESDASWVVVDAQGQLVLPPQRGTLAQAASLATGRRVCIVVPTEDVLLTSAELPVKSGAKLAQIVPFALEEQVADDVDDLHFALGRRQENGRTRIAVVAKSLIDGWLARLSEAGLTAAALHAEGSLLPVAPHQITALLDHDTITLARDGQPPVSMPVDGIAAAFDLFDQAAAAPADAGAPQLPEGMRAPSTLVVYALPEVWAEREADFAAVRGRFAAVRTQLLASGPLPLLGQQLGNADVVNVLQGAFAPKSGGFGDWRAWRLAAMLLGGLIALHVGATALELRNLKSQERKLDEQMDVAFRSAMPGEAFGTDARKRMEDRLLAIRSRQGDQGLLPALSALAQARGASPGTSVEALSFKESTLDLRVAAPDAASIDRINQQLRAAGWQADLTSGSTRGEAYEGRILVKPVGAS